MLITGVSGLLGSNLSVRARDTGYAVHGLFHRHPFHLSGISTDQVDLKNNQGIARTITAFEPSVIVHTAAMSRPDDCGRNPDACHALNVAATERLVEAAQANNCKIIFLSSDLVHAGRSEWMDESEPPRPLGVYARSKVAGEQLALDAYGVRGCVVRTALIYGWSLGAHPSWAQSWVEDLRAGKPLRAFADQVRCPTWVEDLCDAILLIDKRDLRGVYNVVGPEAGNRHEFALALAEEFGLDRSLVERSSMDAFPFADPRPRECLLKSDKMRSEGWRPLGIRPGLRRMRSTEQAMTQTRLLTS